MTDDAAQARYAAYSKLQTAAVASGENFFLPEIVAMVHNPDAAQPQCRLQLEDSEEYGAVIVPETAVADALRDMTQKHLAQLGKPVSSKPIVMRAEYMHCPNLTIIDTPGFIMKARAGEPENTPDEIMEMVKEQCAPPQRLILFLQQSSVEWCSSLWLHVVQAVDPRCQRTVLISSKFDNRVKEFSERWEVDRYLSAAGYLNANLRPFFVALPKERSLSASSEWRRQIQAVDQQILSTLREQISGGFDEAAYGDRMGFASLKRFLEEELARKYKEAAPATLAVLQLRCEQAAADLAEAARQLEAAQDVAALRQAGMQHVFDVAGRVRGLLDGSTASAAAHHGMTTEQERSLLGTREWPGIQGEAQPGNAELLLYGGAAFERCLDEFQEAARCLAFPAVARDQVANVLGAMKVRGQPHSTARAAQDIARASARSVLLPLLEHACQRLMAVLRHVFDVALDDLHSLPEAAKTLDLLRPYVAFNANIRSSFSALVQRLGLACASLLRQQVEHLTSEYAMPAWRDVGPARRPAAALEDDNENLTPDLSLLHVDERRHRAPLQESQQTIPETPSPQQATMRKGPGTRSRFTSAPAPGPAGMSVGWECMGSPYSACTPGPKAEDAHSRICGSAESYFAHIRDSVAASAVPAAKSAMLGPLHQDLAFQLSLQLFGISDTHFMRMFTAEDAVASLKTRQDGCNAKLDSLQACRDDFQDLARHM